LAQISWLCKKKAASSTVHNPSGIVTGETDDIYKFLEQPDNYYVSLLARGPTDDTTITSKFPHGSCTLFNETCMGNCTGHKGDVVGPDADQEMQRVVDDHHQELNTADSKEMMVAIAYGMSITFLVLGFWLRLRMKAKLFKVEAKRESVCIPTQ
jgi:hypothetical protein